LIIAINAKAADVNFAGFVKYIFVESAEDGTNGLYKNKIMTKLENGSNEKRYYLPADDSNAKFDMALLIDAHRNGQEIRIHYDNSTISADYMNPSWLSHGYYRISRVHWGDYLE